MIFTHIGGVRNANAFADGLHYMTHQHEEIISDKTGKPIKYEPILAPDGTELLRDPDKVKIEYVRGDGTTGDKDNFAKECMQTWCDNRKSWNEKAKKADHYVLSLSAEETAKMDIDKTLEMGSNLARELWKGHQVLCCCHADTDYLHVHFIVNSCRQEDREIEEYMDKSKKDQVYAAEYKKGGKHRDTPKFHRWCNDRILEYVKTFRPELDQTDWNKVKDENTRNKTEKSLSKKELLHEAVLIAAAKSKDKDELKKYLQEDYGIAFDVRGSSPRFLYPGDTVYKRADKIGITPMNLTPDLHDLYKPDRDDKVAEAWENRNNKEWKRGQKESHSLLQEEAGEDIVIRNGRVEKEITQIRNLYKNMENEEKDLVRSLLKLKKEESVEDLLMRLEKEKAKSINKLYSNLLRYNDETHERRSMAEILAIAIVSIITGEYPDYLLTEKQKEIIDREIKYQDRKIARAEAKAQKQQKHTSSTEYTR